MYLKSILAAALCVGAVNAQTLVNGRGLVIAASGQRAGTACGQTTACPGPTLNTPGATSATWAVYGSLGGNFAINVLTPAGLIACPLVMPSLGTNLLPGSTVFVAGIMTATSTNGCPGSGVVTVTGPAPGTYRFQAVCLTASGTLAWSTPVRANF